MNSIAQENELVNGNGAYYAVLPANVRYDGSLLPIARLLYAELTALADKKGYCWATNEYFATLYKISERTVSRCIAQLEQGGYIRCEMAATSRGSERRIYAGSFLPGPEGVDTTGQGGVDTDGERGVDKAGTPIEENNISVNITPPNPPTEGSAEPSETASPPVASIPLNDGSEYPVTEEQCREWEALYPAVDVRQQLRTMRGWALSNPQRRKTRKGIKRFINGWLSKEQDRGRPPARAADRPGGGDYWSEAARLR